MPNGVCADNVHLARVRNRNVDSREEQPERQRCPVAAARREKDWDGKRLKQEAFKCHHQRSPAEWNQQRCACPQARQDGKVAVQRLEKRVQPTLVIGLRVPDLAILRPELWPREQRRIAKEDQREGDREGGYQPSSIEALLGVETYGEAAQRLKKVRESACAAG